MEWHAYHHQTIMTLQRKVHLQYHLLLKWDTQVVEQTAADTKNQNTVLLTLHKVRLVTLLKVEQNLPVVHHMAVRLRIHFFLSMTTVFRDTLTIRVKFPSVRRTPMSVIVLKIPS